MISPAGVVQMLSIPISPLLVRRVPCIIISLSPGRWQEHLASSKLREELATWPPKVEKAARCGCCIFCLNVFFCFLFFFVFSNVFFLFIFFGICSFPLLFVAVL